MLYRHKAWQSPMMIDTQRIYRNKPFPLPLLSNTFDYDTLISWLPLAMWWKIVWQGDGDLFLVSLPA
jgi:hypothetical protein